MFQDGIFCKRDIDANFQIIILNDWQPKHVEQYMSNFV